jgi:acyl-coenzyme A synthetase/AMP-(fatty) acid ligase
MEEVELTLRDLIHRAADRHPDKLAATDDVASYTYRELVEKVRQMAKLLHLYGVRKGDRVALMMPPSVSHLIALFGAIELGAIPVALHVRESESILAEILGRISPRVLVYDGTFSEKAASLCKQVTFITASICSESGITPEEKLSSTSDPLIPRDLDNYELDFEPMPVSADETAVIALSSGTTGIPKGVMHTHRTLVASARNGALYTEATEDSTTINIFTTAFIGWYNCTLPFIYGASRLIFISQWDPQGILETIQNEKVTVFFLVPTMWRMLISNNIEDYDFSSLQRVGYAGEPMDSSTMTVIRDKICSKVVNTYGTTETGSWGGCTVMLPEDYENSINLESVGKAAEGVEVRIIEPGGRTDQIVPAGEEGEVIFRGPSVASQIWEQKEVADKIFDKGWWRSGDQGVLDEDGYLYLQGRLDDMIISGGINVLPGQIEETILAHPAVNECVVLGLPNKKWGQQITAFILKKEEVSAEDLGEHVDNSSLSAYKKPRAYYFMDEFPRGNTGKISRRLLFDQISKENNCT